MWRSTEDYSLISKDEKDSISPRRRRLSRPRRAILISVVVAAVAIVVVLAIALPLALRHRGDGDDAGGGASVDWVQRFQEGVSADQISAYMQEYSSRPHIAGSDGDHAEALRTQALLQSFGLDAHIESHPVLLSYPLYRHVEGLLPNGSVISTVLKEAVVNDTTSGVPGAADTYNGYSGSGTARGELVYVNYGRQEDFDAIANIDLTGKIVIVRYGRIFRGNKVSLAAGRGAAGVLIYTDPGDSAGGPEYPAGPWATPTTVQRGTVWVGNGDPATPGFPSMFGGPGISYEQAQMANTSFQSPLPTIPVQPMSWSDAAPLLAGLGVNPLPSNLTASWQGGLNITHFGPGPIQVFMNISLNYTVTPIWNVVGRIEGASEPDRVVMMGCHRDAWTFGAGDPISGHSVLLEVARGFGNLLSRGWRPARTMMFLSWDAEEHGLVGSVEFVEQHLGSLQSQAIVYLNLDIAVTGGDNLWIAGSPSLAALMNNVTKAVSLADGTSAYSKWSPAGMAPLGDGSDFTGFLQHAGVASLDFQFSSNSGSYEAVYHSNYDSFHWFSNFGDPGFKYHASAAQISGRVLMQFLDAPILPLQFDQYASYLSTYIDALRTQGSGLQANFSSLETAIANMGLAWQTVAQEISQVSLSNVLQLRSINDRLMLAERAFLGDKTQSGREWYRHVVYAPSLIDSYAGQPFPGIFAAVSGDDVANANFVIQRVAQQVDAVSEALSGTFWKTP